MPVTENKGQKSSYELKKTPIKIKYMCFYFVLSQQSSRNILPWQPHDNENISLGDEIQRWFSFIVHNKFCFVSFLLFRSSARARNPKKRHCKDFVAWCFSFHQFISIFIIHQTAGPIKIFCWFILILMCWVYDVCARRRLKCVCEWVCRRQIVRPLMFGCRLTK